LATLVLTGEAPGSITLVGVVPLDLELGIELSFEVSAVLGQAVEWLATELRGLGYPLAPKRPAAIAVI